MKAKNMLFGLLTGAMLFGTTLTVLAEDTITETSSKTTTRHVTDAMGNEYALNHVIETVNGETTERYENIPFILHNETEDEMTAIHMVTSDSDSWGSNGLEFFGDDYTLKGGESAYGLTAFYYLDDPLYDIKVEMANGSDAIAENFDFSELALPGFIDFYLIKDAETGEYLITLESTSILDDVIVINWSDYEDQLDSDERLASGSFFEEESIGLKFFIPSNMEEVELTDADKEKGFLRLFVSDDDEMSINILLTEDDTVKNVNDYAEKLEEANDPRSASINDLPAITYATSDEATGDPISTIAFVGEAGSSIIEFNFRVSDMEDDFSGLLALVVASSIQPMY